MVRVKICGNTDAGQVELCAACGADCVGFVVEYPVAVPWNLAREDAAPLVARVPPMIARAVVTGGEAEKVLAIARFLMPHLVQLHTDNSLEETAAIAGELSGLGIALIRAVRIDAATGRASGQIEDPLEAVLGLEQAGVAAVLLDARTRDMPAGTGVALDWGMAGEIRAATELPLVLAGGLTPENVRRAVEQVQPFAVDVISGVEAARTVKSAERVRRFIQEAKGL